MLLSLIGRKASFNIPHWLRFPSKHMYLYLSLIEREVAEFYQIWNGWKALCGLGEITYFHQYLESIAGGNVFRNNPMILSHYTTSNFCKKFLMYIPLSASKFASYFGSHNSLFSKFSKNLKFWKKIQNLEFFFQNIQNHKFQNLHFQLRIAKARGI